MIFALEYFSGGLSFSIDSTVISSSSKSAGSYEEIANGIDEIELFTIPANLVVIDTYITPISAGARAVPPKGSQAGMQIRLLTMSPSYNSLAAAEPLVLSIGLD